MLDHLTRCGSCRRFYLEARALGSLVAVTNPAVRAEPSPDGRIDEVWLRIEDRIRPRGGSAAGLPRWAMAAAAALVIGAVLALLPWSWFPQTSPSREMEVLLEGDAGEMTERRFLELATEVLRADRRYHFAMRDVMDKVITDEWESEGSMSEGGGAEESDDEENDESGRRLQT